MGEYVMVFPATLLKEAGYFQGLSFEVQKYFEWILRPGNLEFIRRQHAEGDPSYKQVIPYVILTHEDTVFAYRRGKLLSEERLLGHYSIGVGGHISINDPSLFGMTYQEALFREVGEEVVIESQYDVTPVAVINDDSDEVGGLHFGLVHVATLDSTSVRKREKSINETRFMTIPELNESISKFESWSRICISEIDNLISGAEAAPVIEIPVPPPRVFRHIGER